MGTLILFAAAALSTLAWTAPSPELHALNRLSYGPRPGDVERVRSAGVNDYIEEQLHPRNIPDRDCDEALKGYKTLTMSPEQLYAAYPPPRQDGKGKRDRKDKNPERSPKRIILELGEAKLLRAVHSARQLEEVMVDFWFNHFNVDARKGQVKWLVTSYERDAIRPHALGKFRDLLGATAHHPAMLMYLDNAQSTVDSRYAPAYMREQIAAMEERMELRGKTRKRLGLNENYTRELLELHTLGVDGGYGQKDVLELARVLTGWSVERPGSPRGQAGFVFRKRMHDRGRKTVMGRVFEDDGEAEGERALDMLARHPSTARFIATKLCRRFVADEPPPELVERAAKAFTYSGGDIKQTLREIFASAEFRDPGRFRSKVKTPFEFTVSALRATGAELREPAKALRALNDMGQPPYMCEPPTGYPDKAEAWVNSGALVARMQLATALLGAGKRGPATVDLEALAPGFEEAPGTKTLERLIKALLGGEVKASTRRVLMERLEDPEVSRAALDDAPRGVDARKLAALVLGSPDFQRR